MRIVHSVRRGATALLLAASLIGSTTIPAFASPASRCCAHDSQAAASTHPCCRAMVRSCCASESLPDAQTAPVKPRTELKPLLVAIAPAVRGADPGDSERVVRGHAAPPPRSADLTTLFRALLL